MGRVVHSLRFRGVDPQREADHVGMIQLAKLRHLRGLLWSRASLLLGSDCDANSGRTRREVDRLIADGGLVALRRGWFVRTTDWEGSYSEDRHLLRVLAASEAASSPGPVFSHYSAAALHGLPLFRVVDHRAHTTSPEPVGKSNAVVVRHIAQLAEDEVEAVADLRVTDLIRTVIDVARIARPESSLCCADAALRRVSNSGSNVQLWRASVQARLDGLGRARGVVTARRILEFADPGADSPLESISRLYLHRLGFEVRTQVPVPSPSGGEYTVDLELVGLDLLGEVDGKVKYADAEMRAGATPEEVVFAEKKREDWIRGVTGKKLIRWGARELASLATFEQYLRSMGVEIPLRRSGNYSI